MSDKCHLNAYYRFFLLMLFCWLPAASFAQTTVFQQGDSGNPEVQEVSSVSGDSAFPAKFSFSDASVAGSVSFSPVLLAVDTGQCLREAKKALEYCIVELAKDKTYCHGRYAVRVRQCSGSASSL